VEANTAAPAAPAVEATPAAEAAQAAPAAPAQAAQANSSKLLGFVGTLTGKIVVAAALLILGAVAAVTTPVVNYHGTKVSVLELQSFETKVDVRQRGGWFKIPVYFGKATVSVKQQAPGAGEDDTVVVLYNGHKQ
jgi:hypothetical protein